MRECLAVLLRLLQAEMYDEPLGDIPGPEMVLRPALALLEVEPVHQDLGGADPRESRGERATGLLVAAGRHDRVRLGESGVLGFDDAFEDDSGVGDLVLDVSPAPLRIRDRLRGPIHVADDGPCRDGEDRHLHSRLGLQLRRQFGDQEDSGLVAEFPDDHLLGLVIADKLPSGLPKHVPKPVIHEKSSSEMRKLR